MHPALSRPCSLFRREVPSFHISWRLDSAVVRPLIRALPAGMAQRHPAPHGALRALRSVRYTVGAPAGPTRPAHHILPAGRIKFPRFTRSLAPHRVKHPHMHTTFPVGSTIRPGQPEACVRVEPSSRVKPGRHVASRASRLILSLSASKQITVATSSWSVCRQWVCGALHFAWLRASPSRTNSDS